MPDLKTLLEGAAPPATAIDVVAIRDRGVRWRRKRRTVVVTALAAVIGISAPLSVAVAARSDRHGQHVAATSPPTTPPTTPPTEAVLERLAFEATAVATDQAHLWAIGPSPTHGLRIAELDPETGRTVREAALPTPTASWLAFGADHLWVGQAADGAEPKGSLSVLNPETLEVVATARLSAYAAAFTGDVAIVTSGAGGTVSLLRVVGGAFQIRVVPVGEQPTNVAVSRSGQVWVQEAGGTVAQIDPVGGQVQRRVPWEGHLITGSEVELSSDDAVLAVDSGNRVVEAEPGSTNDPIRLRTRFLDPSAADLIDGTLWASGRDGVEAVPVGASNSYATPMKDCHSLAVVGGTAYFVAGGGGGGLWRWQPLGS